MRSLLILALLFISCSKSSNSDQQPEQPPKDPLNLSAKLVGTWKITAATSTPAYDWNRDGVAETDMYATRTSCEKNLGFIFLPDGTGEMDFTCSIKCPTKWEVVNNSKIFKYNFSTNGGSTWGADVKDTIVELTASKFVIRSLNEPEPGKFHTITRAYAKQ